MPDVALSRLLHLCVIMLLVCTLFLISQCFHHQSNFATFYDTASFYELLLYLYFFISIFVSLIPLLQRWLHSLLKVFQVSLFRVFIMFLLWMYTNQWFSCNFEKFFFYLKWLEILYFIDFSGMNQHESSHFRFPVLYLIFYKFYRYESTRIFYKFT